MLRTVCQECSGPKAIQGEEHSSRQELNVRTVRITAEKTEINHPFLTESPYNPVGNINRRSPPVSLLGTVSAVILISGGKREQHSAPHGQHSSTLSAHPGYGPRTGTIRLIVHKTVMNGQHSAHHCPQRSGGGKGDHSAQSTLTIGNNRGFTLRLSNLYPFFQGEQE